jgi:DNA modification methylase
MPKDNQVSKQAVRSISELVQNLELQIEWMALDQLSAFGRKARIHTKKNIQMLANVLREFGCLVPLVVDENGKVLAGNARIEAARMAGLDRLPVVKVSHLTDTQKRLFVIADNRLAELAGWDREILKVEFAELLEIDLGGPIELSGFSEVEVEGLKLETLRDNDKADQVPGPIAQPVSRLGDVWILGSHRLICGDSSTPEVMALIPEGQVRTVFEDPPYNQPGRNIIADGEHGTFIMGSGEMSDGEFTDFLARNFANVRRALMPGGLAYVCMDHHHMENVLAAARQAELEMLTLVVWDKGSGGMGSFYRSRHELIFVLRKPGAQHLNRIELGKNGRDRANVWSYPSVGGFGIEKIKARESHPTCKPVALVRDALLDCSARGDLVLDFFCGSGTTLIAAEQAGRCAIAVELDPKYVDVGLVRWQDFTGKEVRHAKTGETFIQVRARRAAEFTVPVNEPGPIDPAPPLIRTRLRHVPDSAAAASVEA